MTADRDGFRTDRLNRILPAVETIEESLDVLACKQRVSRKDYKANSNTRDIVEYRFVKMTEAAIDIAEALVTHERGQPPASNPESPNARETSPFTARRCHIVGFRRGQRSSVEQRPDEGDDPREQPRGLIISPLRLLRFLVRIRPLLDVGVGVTHLG